MTPGVCDRRLFVLTEKDTSISDERVESVQEEFIRSQQNSLELSLSSLASVYQTVRKIVS